MGVGVSEQEMGEEEERKTYLYHEARQVEIDFCCTRYSDCVELRAYNQRFVRRPKMDRTK